MPHLAGRGATGPERRPERPRTRRRPAFCVARPVRRRPRKGGARPRRELPARAGIYRLRKEGDLRLSTLSATEAVGLVAANAPFLNTDRHRAGDLLDVTERLVAGVPRFALRVPAGGARHCSSRAVPRKGVGGGRERRAGGSRDLRRHGRPRLGGEPALLRSRRADVPLQPRLLLLLQRPVAARGAALARRLPTTPRGPRADAGLPARPDGRRAVRSPPRLRDRDEGPGAQFRREDQVERPRPVGRARAAGAARPRPVRRGGQPSRAPRRRTTVTRASPGASTGSSATSTRCGRRAYT